jgi:hypothetical protein
LSFENDLADARSRRRGAVFHHFSARAAKTKYLVVLNHTWPPDDGLVVYAFTTTNVGHFTNAFVLQPIVRLNPGEYPFITAPTVVDRTRPEIEQLAAIVNAPAFKFIVQLGPDHMKEIDDAVRESTVITRRLKKMILAGYG